MNKNISKLNFFISYSHKNMRYKEKLLTSLEALKQSYNIETWHDGMIGAGNNIDENVKKAMNTSNVILLLVTDNFLASYYCMKIELEEAIEREKQNKCIIIPVMFQESVLTDGLAFIKNNRVPEDGKPIATGFKNQNLGCTRATNMIKSLIDKNFANCKKNNLNNTVKKTRDLVTNKKKNMYIEIYKNGTLSKIPISQNIIDIIPKYFCSVNIFQNMMDQSLVDAKKRITKSYKNSNGTMSEKEKMSQLRLYLMDICAYTKTYITENVGIKVHFRASKENYYVGLIASTDEDDSTDLSSDWTSKMTPIPMYQGLIYYSSRFHAPLIKSLNSKLNFKATNDDTWKDYITFTFPKLHSGQTPLISYSISIHKDYYKVKSDMLKILAYINFGDVIEKYIIDYIDICKKIDKSYNLENIINSI